MAAPEIHWWWRGFRQGKRQPRRGRPRLVESLEPAHYNESVKKLPLGIQTFRDIVQDGYLYVDKTQHIYRLVTEGKYYFLSRPRRFGKSLLVSTLKELFSGNRDLFQGLWICDKIDWKIWPVLHLDFSLVSYQSPEQLDDSLHGWVKRAADEHGVVLDPTANGKLAFYGLLRELAKTRRVVLLVDEYDKPLIDFVDKPEIALANREVLRSFYSTIKGCDEYLRFVLLTGVSKFARVSIFSGLNNLRDITFADEFSVMLGYTDDELESHFSEYIDSMAMKNGFTPVDMRNRIREWYNGYSWDGARFVYNPFSILSLFTDNRFGNYWFETGTPTFLMKLIRARALPVQEFESVIADEYLFESYDITNLEMTSLLFQTGYLTVKERRTQLDRTEYLLSYPNMEVRDAFMRHLLREYTEGEFFEGLRTLRQLSDAIRKADLDSFFAVMRSLFASIPYNMFVPDREAYYQTVIYLLLRLLGADIRTEVQTNVGRIDAVIETSTRVFVVEFKLGTAAEAIAQIREKRYHEKFLSSGKEVLLVGVGIDVEKRNITDYAAEPV